MGSEGSTPLQVEEPRAAGGGGLKSSLSKFPFPCVHTVSMWVGGEGFCLGSGSHYGATRSLPGFCDPCSFPFPCFPRWVCLLPSQG